MSLSQWALVTIQLRSKLHGMTGGMHRVFSSLRLKWMAHRNRRVFLSSLFHLRMSQEVCTLAMPSLLLSKILWLAGSSRDNFTYQFRLMENLCRNRMLGKTTLFVPGFDHAGISTQSVVEKRLFKTTGQTKHDLGREKFLSTVLDWKNE
jgi:hypothetical protein